MYTLCRRCELSLFDGYSIQFDQIPESGLNGTTAIYGGREYSFQQEGEFLIEAKPDGTLQSIRLGDHDCNSSALQGRNISLIPSTPSFVDSAAPRKTEQHYSLWDLDQAIAINSSRDVQMIIDSGVKPTNGIYLKAVGLNSNRLVEILLQSRVIPATHVLLEAIKLNNCPMSEMLVANGTQVTQDAYKEAILLSSNQLVSILTASKLVVSDQNLQLAISFNSNRLVELLLSTGVCPTDDHMQMARNFHNSTMVQMLWEAKMVWEAKFKNKGSPSPSQIFPKPSAPPLQAPAAMAWGLFGGFFPNTRLVEVNPESSKPSASSSSAQSRVSNVNHNSSAAPKATGSPSIASPLPSSSVEESVLAHAIRSEQINAVRALIQAGYKPTESEMHLALNSKNEQIITLLCGPPIDPNAPPPPYQQPADELPPPFQDPFDPGAKNQPI